MSKEKYKKPISVIDKVKKFKSSVEAVEFVKNWCNSDPSVSKEYIEEVIKTLDYWLDVEFVVLFNSFERDLQLASRANE